LHHSEFQNSSFKLTERRGGRQVAKKAVRIEEPKGKLGVLICGLGAVATTFIAGVNRLAHPNGNDPPGQENGKARAAH
jgi:hypothetical protein